MFVPYSKYILPVHLAIAVAYNAAMNQAAQKGVTDEKRILNCAQSRFTQIAGNVGSLIELDTVEGIAKRYARIWMGMLAANGISGFSPDLSERCLRVLTLQFMQVRLDILNYMLKIQ